MGIWLDELEKEVRNEARLALRDRRALREALDTQHMKVNEGGGVDSLLLVVDALPRLSADSAHQEQGQDILRSAIARQPLEAFALRKGQASVLIEGANADDTARRMLVRLDRQLKTVGQGQYMMVVGAARASETKLGPAAWLALADLRLQMRLAHLGLGQGSSDNTGMRRPLTLAIERRRTGKR